MILESSISSAVQECDDIRLVTIDCQECEYHDTFESVEEADLYLRGHVLVSRHYDIDIGVELRDALRTIDCEITVGNSIES